MKILKTKVINPNDSLKKAADLMIEGMRNIYVVDKSKLVGVIGVRDILLMIKKGNIDSNMKVKQAMNLKPERVTKKQGAEYAYVLMKKYNTTSCPVTNKKGEFIGITTFNEVCKEISMKIKK